MKIKRTGYFIQVLFIPEICYRCFFEWIACVSLQYAGSKFALQSLVIQSQQEFILTILIPFLLPLLLLFQLVSTSPVEAVSLEELRLYGYIDLKYQKASNTQGDAIGITKDGSFDNHHFNLLFDFPVTQRLIVRGHIEFEHGVDTTKNYGGVKTEWAFFQYNFFDELKARGGKTFDPELVQHFKKALPKILEIKGRFADGLHL